MSDAPPQHQEQEAPARYRPCDPVASHEPTVRRFITTVSEHALRVGAGLDGVLQISRVHPATDKLNVVGRFKMDDVDHMVEAAIIEANSGFNVYIELRIIRPDAPRRGDAGYTVAVFGLARDNDADKNKTAKAALQPSLRVETSPGNYHDIFFASERLSVEVAKEIGAGMRGGGGDSDTGTITQPYRIAGTPNYPNLTKQRRGRFDVHLTSILEHSGETYTEAQLRAAHQIPAKDHRASSGTGGTSGEGVDWRLAFEKLPWDLQALIRAGVPPGKRSDKFHFVVCRLKYLGWSEDNVHELLDSHPNGIAQKYAGRLRKNVNASFAKGDAPPSAADFGPERGADNAKAKSRFEVTWAKDVKLFTTRRDLIKGLLPREGLAVLWGKWKSIKSFWLLDALMHVALGWDYRGRRVQQGPVIYLVLEAPGGFMTRVVGWLQTFLADHEMPPFGIIACNIDLVRDHVALIDSIRSALGGIAPAVIAIDTVNRSLAGSEGADQDMSAYVAACDAVQKALGGLIVLVHHHGHNDTRMRGFTGLPAAEDVELFSKREGDLHTIEVTQRRDGATGDRVVSRVEEVIVGQDDDGQVITTLVLRSVDDEWEVPLTHEQIFEQAVEAA